MSEKETKTFKIKWTKVLKKVSPYNIKKGILYLRHYGPKEFWVKLTERFQADDVDYEQWYENHKALPEELEKQKNEKNRKTRNRILKKAGERYGTYINLYNFEHYYCCRSNLGDYRILSISSGSKNE